MIEISSEHQESAERFCRREILQLAREPVAWGATKDVLTAENLLKARRMCEAFDEHAEACAA